ncbi:contactin-2-like [Branchiostoma lanceolatum]|uniref:contactin-2-like n=1 Tax=Branchiostoma lanceolatum TaxID=7740 RepID=UPI0034550618
MALHLGGLLVILVCYPAVVWTQFEPRITLSPTAQIFNPQDPRQTVVRFQCEAESDPPPQYSWERDGVLVDISAGNGKYVITGGDLIINTPTKSDDEGEYQCLARNDVGVEVSSPASLMFAFADPFDTASRSGITLQAGESAFIQCNPPDSYPGLSFSWYRDSPSNIVDNTHRVFISDKTGDLYISYVTETDSGDYFCLVRNLLDTAPDDVDISVRTSQPTRLTVSSGDPTQRAATIALNAEDEDVLKGQTETLNCFANGYPRPNIFWARVDDFGNDVALPRRSRFHNWNHIFILPEVTEEDSGIYRCTAENSFGTAVTEARIIVRAPPVLQPLPDRDLVEGSRVNWTCKATGSEPITYTWYGIQQDPLQTAGRIVVGANTLTINNVRASDLGRYQCVAQNQWGSTQSSAKLHIGDVIPAWLTPIGTYYAVPGSSVTMTTRWEADPDPTFRWTKDGRPINSGGRYTITPDGNLVINGATSEDEGDYSCTLVNRWGTAVSYGNLTLIDPTRMPTGRGPTDLTLDTGDTGVIPCDATFDPRLDHQYLWFRNGQKIDFDLESENYERVESGGLRIKNAFLAQDATFTCSAETPIDKEDGVANVNIIAPNHPPVGVEATNLDTTTGDLLWHPSSDNGAPPGEYSVEAMSDHEPAWGEVQRGPISELQSAPDPDARSLLKLRNLSPWTCYNFRVMTINSLGISTPSSQSNRECTGIAPPTVAPTNLGGGGGLAGDTIMRWDPLQPKDWNAPWVGYRLRHRSIAQASGDWTEQLLNDSQASFFARSSPQAPAGLNEPYEAKIRAFNAAGDGPETSWTVYSSAGIPPGVQNLVVTGTTNDSAQLRWDNPVYQGDLDYYNVRYWVEMEDGRKKREVAENRYSYVQLYPEGSPQAQAGYPAYTVNNGKVSGIVSNLYPGTLYNFQVSPKAVPYSGPYTTTAQGRTHPNALLAAGRIAVGSLGWLYGFFWFLFALLLLLLLLLLCCCCCCCCACCGRRKRVKKDKKQGPIIRYVVDEMTVEHKKQLLKYREPIVEHVNPYPVVDYLVLRGCITKSTGGEIRMLESPEAIRRVLDVMPARPDPTFYHFCDAVRLQHPWLADRLEGKVSRVNSSSSDIPTIRFEDTVDMPAAGATESSALLSTGRPVDPGQMNPAAVDHGIGIQTNYTDVTFTNMTNVTNVTNVRNVTNVMSTVTVEEQYRTLTTINTDNTGEERAVDVGSDTGGDVGTNMVLGSSQSTLPETEVTSEPEPIVEPHPFQAQSGSIIQVKRGQPVIIEIFGDAGDVRWLYEDTPLPNSDLYEQTSDGDEFHSLYIKNVTRDNHGCYTCQGQTEYGLVCCDIHIQVVN